MTDSDSVRSGAVRVPGAVLRYVAGGEGVPVLVVGSAVYYPRTFSPRLADGCTLAFADLRHFAAGEVPGGPGRVTFGLYAADIEAVREALGFERVAVVGHSKHGNLALEYAKRYPGRASHVVLIGSPPVGLRRVAEARERYWEANASERRRAALRRNRDALRAAERAALPPGDALVADYVADGPKYWYDHDFDASSLWRGVPVNVAVLDAIHGLFAEYEVSWDPASLRAPVLVVTGRHDYVVPHVLWDEVLPRLRNVTYHRFESSGHTPQLEEQAPFDRRLLEWLGTT